MKRLFCFAGTGAVLCISLLIFMTYSFNSAINTSKIKNEEIKEVFKHFDINSYITVKADSLGKQYIDSINIIIPEKQAELKEIISERATRIITDQSDKLNQTATHIHNTLIFWATILTLLSIIFTFLGLMELKDRLLTVEKGINKIDQKTPQIEGMIRDMEYSVREIDARKNEIVDKSNEADKKINNIDSKITEVNEKISEIDSKTKTIDKKISAIDSKLILADEKIEDVESQKFLIDEALKNMKSETKVSTYNMELQLIMKENQDKQLTDLKEILTKITSEDEKDLNEKSKSELASVVCNTIGKIHGGLHNFQEAKTYFLKSLSYNKANVLPYAGLGLIHYFEKNWHKAKHYFGEAIRLSPSNDSYYLYRGNINFELEDFAKAKEDYYQALKINTYNARAYFMLGKIAFEEKDQSDGLDLFKNAVLNGFKDEELFSNVAKILVQNNLDDEAIKIIEKGLEKRNYKKEEFDQEIQGWAAMIHDIRNDIENPDDYYQDPPDLDY